MKKVCLSDSICLISRRSDVISFCMRTIGCLEKIRVISEVSSAVCNFTNLILIDAEVLRLQEKKKTWENLRNRYQSSICLLPPDCTTNQKIEMSQCFDLVIPIPCEISFFQKVIIELENCPLTKTDSLLLLKSNKIPENPVFQNFYGKSQLLSAIKQQLEIIAQNDKTVLLVGETGTGKSTVAKLIHELSKRKNKRFSTLSIPHFSEDLFCSTLFGSKKGAYTDAVEKDGIFKLSDKGTVFLDEVGFATQKIQGNLLTFIETGVFKSVGSEIDEKVDVRLIFATNENLSKMRKEGTFREDFYHRIAGYKIYLPALREHIDDLEEIVTPMLEANNKILDRYALEKLKNYDWPGNIRELKNCIDKACTFCPKSVITSDYILFDL